MKLRSRNKSASAPDSGASGGGEGVAGPPVPAPAPVKEKAKKKGRGGVGAGEDPAGGGGLKEKSKKKEKGAAATGRGAVIPVPAPEKSKAEVVQKAAVMTLAEASGTGLPRGGGGGTGAFLQISGGAGRSPYPHHHPGPMPTLPTPPRKREHVWDNASRRKLVRLETPESFSPKILSKLAATPPKSIIPTPVVTPPVKALSIKDVEGWEWEYTGSGITWELWEPQCHGQLCSSFSSSLKKFTRRIFKVSVQPQVEQTNNGSFSRSMVLKICNYSVKNGKMVNITMLTTRVEFYPSCRRAIFSFQLVDPELSGKSGLSLEVLKESCKLTFGTELAKRHPETGVTEDVEDLVQFLLMAVEKEEQATPTPAPVAAFEVGPGKVNPFVRLLDTSTKGPEPDWDAEEPVINANSTPSVQSRQQQPESPSSWDWDEPEVKKEKQKQEMKPKSKEDDTIVLPPCTIM